MTIVESLACSTPVIASDTPNLTETVHSGENGYTFRTGNADDLCRTVRKLSSLSAEETAVLRRNAKTAYQSRFTEAVIYEKMMEIYKKP